VKNDKLDDNDKFDDEEYEESTRNSINVLLMASQADDDDDYDTDDEDEDEIHDKIDNNMIKDNSNMSLLSKENNTKHQQANSMTTVVKDENVRAHNTRQRRQKFPLPLHPDSSITNTTTTSEGKSISEDVIKQESNSKRNTEEYEEILPPNSKRMRRHSIAF
jgi:preprotein translocase subunit SecD